MGRWHKIIRLIGNTTSANMQRLFGHLPACGPVFHLGEDPCRGQFAERVEHEMVFKTAS
jgi:hypothetical protein